MSQKEKPTPNPTDENKRLRKLISEYEKKIDEIADEVSRVRHEINNPLTAILGQSQLLLREELNEQARKRAETIEDIARRLAKTVGDLRQIQKPIRLALPDTGE
jgi:signal transduction histidine kinase